MTTYAQALAANNGTVKHGDLTLALTQQAYAAYAGDAYYASAIDEDGDKYHVTWATLCDLADIDDESEACDWANPINIEAI